MKRAAVLALWLAARVAALWAADTVEHPFLGVTHIIRSETSPRTLHIHIVKIDLTAPGIRFRLTPPGGKLETVRQTTLAFLKQEHAQIAINAHFFMPFPSSNPDASLVGFAASDGAVYSAFETPVQSYAIVSNAPALNIDSADRAGIVHRDPRFADGRHVLEKVEIWNALAGSAQIVTDGVKTIPRYADGSLTPGGPNQYSDARSWYDVLQARSAIGLAQDGHTLFLFTVDVRGGSAGMRVGEVADMLLREGAYNALNLDGGGSTTLAIEDRIVNVPSDNPAGRAVGSNLAVFASRRNAGRKPNRRAGLRLRAVGYWSQCRLPGDPPSGGISSLALRYSQPSGETRWSVRGSRLTFGGTCFAIRSFFLPYWNPAPQSAAIVRLGLAPVSW